MLCGAQAEGIRCGNHADLLPPIEAHFIPASVESIRFRPHYQRSRPWRVLPRAFLEAHVVPVQNDGEVSPSLTNAIYVCVSPN